MRSFPAFRLFCVIDRNEIQSRWLPADVMACRSKWIWRDLEIGLRSLPSTQPVYVVVGQSKFTSIGSKGERVQNFQPAREVDYLAGLPMATLLTQLADCPDHSLIYYLHIFEDGDGRSMPGRSLDLIAAKPTRGLLPCRCLSRPRAVGGRVFSFENAGEVRVSWARCSRVKARAIGIRSPARMRLCLTGGNYNAGEFRNPAFPRQRRPIQSSQ